MFKHLHVINKHTILIDLTKSSLSLTAAQDKARILANLYFFGESSGIVRDQQRNGDSGFFLGGNTLNCYHVQSVADGLFIIATKVLSPSQTRPIARNYIK